MLKTNLFNLFLLLLPFSLFGQSQPESFRLLTSLEAIKKERVTVQNEFFTTQRKLVVKLDSKINLTEAEVTQCTDAITKIKNLRYSFGLDPQLYCRIYFQSTSNKSQNKIGKEELDAELQKLFSYNLKTEAPLTKKDLDEAALCLRSMFNILRLEVFLSLSRDQEILYKLGYAGGRYRASSQ